jgi:hypothetical protein
MGAASADANREIWREGLAGVSSRLIAGAELSWNSRQRSSSSDAYPFWGAQFPFLRHGNFPIYLPNFSGL